MGDLQDPVDTDDRGGERYRRFLVEGVSLHGVRPAVRRENLLMLLIPDTRIADFDLLLRGELRKISGVGDTATALHGDEQVMGARQPHPLDTRARVFYAVHGRT